MSTPRGLQISKTLESRINKWFVAAEQQDLQELEAAGLTPLQAREEATIRAYARKWRVRQQVRACEEVTFGRTAIIQPFSRDTQPA